MRRKEIGRQPRLTLVRGGDGVEDNGSASTIYGPVKAGLTIPQRTNKEVPLMESLNELERQVETLESKSSEVLDTLSTVIKHLAVLLPFITSTTTIDKEKENN
jgi:hypothetical protein